MKLTFTVISKKSSALSFDTANMSSSAGLPNAHMIRIRTLWRELERGPDANERFSDRLIEIYNPILMALFDAPGEGAVTPVLK